MHEAKKPFKCNICNTRFALNGNLNTHIAFVHQEEKPFKCDICVYMFKQKSKMSRHRDSVQGGRKAFQMQHLSEKLC